MVPFLAHLVDNIYDTLRRLTGAHVDIFMCVQKTLTLRNRNIQHVK